MDFAQSSCDPSQPNGQLTASALTDGAASTEGYTYEWFVGGDTSTPFDPATDGTISGTDGEVISELSAQTYTILITDLSSGCQDEVSYTLPEEIKKPVIDIDPTTDITANTVCDPSLTNPAITYNGAIQSAVTYDGAAITLLDYRFDWYAGTDTSVAPVFTGTGEDSYTNIADGTYTLVVTRITAGPGFGCSSDPVTVVVPNERELPAGTITMDFAQSSCDPSQPNGQLTASALTGGSASADGYTYEWFVGGDTSTPFDPSTDGTVSGTDGEVISELSAQTYTILVTDLSSGCQDEVSYALPEEIKKPVIDIDPTTDITANTVCDPSLTNPSVTYNGAIQSAVTYDGAAITLSDYRFDWYTGTDTSVPVAFSGLGDDNYANLAPGDYTLIVTKEATGPGQFCSSEPITVTVTNDINTPTASINKDASQTSCGSPNGQLTASALTGGAASGAGYTYEWFVGTDTSAPFNDGVDGDVTGGTGETIENIDAGDYAVRVTDLATGCQTLQNIYLDENIIDPVVEASVTTPFVDCNTDVEITPNITSTNAAPNGHDFTWYEGQFASGASLVTTTDDGFSPVLSEPNTGVAIYSGYYTVVATDRYTGCVSDPFTIFVDRPAAQFDILTNVNFLPSTCGVEEGIVTAWVDLDGDGDPSLVETDYTDYTFEWYLGNPTDLEANYYTDPGPDFDPNNAIAIDQNGIYPGSVPGSAGIAGIDYFGPENPNAGATLFGRESGRYTVVVTNENTGCKEFVGVDIGFTDAAQVTVGDVQIENSTNCATPNGNLEVLSLDNVPGTQDFNDYIYNWYEGTNEDFGNEIVDGSSNVITNALLDRNGTIVGLSPGYYTVVPIEDFGSNCRLTPYTIFLDSAARQPDLAAAITPNTSCVGNGEITVTPSKGAGDTTPVTTYSYSWSSGETTATISDKLPGDYTVTVTDDDTDCSVTKTYTIRDERVTPEISDITGTSQFYCNANGTLTILDTEITPGITSEYDFTVYLNGTDAGNIITHTQNVVAGGVEFTDLVAGTYYVTATRNIAGADAEGCTSAFIQKVVDDELDPVVLNLSQEANTACDPATNSDASVELTMSTPSSDGGISGASYNITVDNQPGTTLNDQVGVNSPFVFGADAPGNGENVLPGSYTFTIENTVSGCITTRSITVEDNPEPIIFSRSDLSVRSAEYCVPSGRIEVNTIGPAAVSDYTFTWYEGKANYDSNTPIGGVNGPLLDSMTYANIGAGVYYVVATRGAGIDPGSSCSSVGVKVEIPEAQVEPTVALSQTANTACDADPNSDATITVTMSTASTYGPISSSNYDITFTSKPAGATVADVTDVTSPYTFTSSPGDLILPGSYTIELFNRESECTTTRSITVEDNPEPIVLRRSDLTIVNSTNCSPSGSIEVNTIAPSIPAGVNDYIFTWYDGETDYTNNDPISGVSGPVLDNTNYTTIHPGVYYVVATRNVGVNPGSSCVSNVVSVEILDDAVNPDIVIVENDPNSSCDPANPNGSMSASVNGQTLTDYTFEWFVGSNNTTNAVDASLISGPAGETVSGLAAGNYTVKVTDNTAPGEACSSIESFYLSEDLTISVAKNVTFDITPQSDCFDSGSITVASLNPGVSSDFTYEWYYENYDASGLISGETTASLTGRPAGSYYVIITNSATSCVTENPIEVEIPFTASSPAIELTDAKPNTDCNPVTPDGFLEVAADGGQTSDYTFTWYEGGLPIASDANLIGNANRLNELDSGYYSVIVYSALTNCSDTAQFYVEFLPELPKISLSTSPVTNCGSPNGSAYAQIYNLDGNFEFNWYIGTSIKNQADFTGPWQRDLPVGEYIVEAIDLDAPDCVSDPVSFTITERIEEPQLKLNQISPNTYCDPEKVNGVAEAILYYVDEDDPTDSVFVTSNFEVLWYRTASLPDATPEFNGRINSELSAAEYTVTYRNVTTNCLWEENIVITEDLTIIPPPDVEITAMFDSCEEPNGAAEISASDLNPNYIYKWYLNELSDIADFETSEVAELEIGNYLVTATDTISGCVSEPREVEITANRQAPIINLSLEPENCGDYNGVATISINSDYEYQAIEWETPYGTAYGESYDEFTAGDYSVTVIGSNGCAYTEEFTITSEINVYNGVSPNNDGENDRWEIGCIENFQQNKVEIYNRAGALVFSAQNYGNSSNVFEGFGNRGVYAGEKKLPDGTYFYIIDKGDGSEVVKGYLELFR